MSFDSPSVPVAIRVENIGKFYPARLTGARMLRYLWPTPLQPRPGDFWALRDVSLDVEAGRVLGVIGRNGGGKSTLLRMIAGLLEPSTGRVTVNGTTAALIELGAGFNPEFTGRENIFMSGAVYGYDSSRMREIYDEIVAFADIGPHLDQPVKTYSSGMFARLAFAVAIQVNPDILLVDEILSVGDLSFQAKCFRKIEELRARGMTVVFVSHDLNAVQMLCDSVVVLREGRIALHADPKTATDHYIHLLSSTAPSRAPASDPGRVERSRVEILDVELLNSRGEATVHPRAGERCRVRYRARFHDEVADPILTFQIKTLVGVVVADHTTLTGGRGLETCRSGDEVQATFDFTMNLAPGAFRVGVGVAESRGGVPIPLFGDESLGFEVVSDRPAHGIAFLDTKIALDRLSARGQESPGR